MDGQGQVEELPPDVVEQTSKSVVYSDTYYNVALKHRNPDGSIRGKAADYVAYEAPLPLPQPVSQLLFLKYFFFFSFLFIFLIIFKKSGKEVRIESLS